MTRRAIAFLAVVLLTPLLVTVHAPATAGTTLKMPFPKTVPWHMHQGWHGGGSPAVDLQPISAAQRGRAPVLAVAAGSATLFCADGGGMAWVKVSVAGVGTFGYAHLDGSDALARYGAVGRSKSLRQGDVVGLLYPDAGTGCGQQSSAGPHLHFIVPDQDLLYDGFNLSTAAASATLSDPYELPAGTNAVPRRGLASQSGAMVVTPDGWTWLAAVKKDGTLYTRRGKVGEGWTSFSRQGAAGTWKAATLTASPDGWVWLAAVKKDGTLYTRRGKIGEGWEPFSRHGTAGSWASAELAGSPDGWVWLSAVKKDGTLYTRRGKIGEGWTSFSRQGAAGTWRSADLAGSPDGWVWLSAVKKDGTLYTRRGKIGDGWESFSRHGTAGSWASAELAGSPDGWVWLSAVKKDGTLYTRRGKIGEGWTSFSRQGAVDSWASADLAGSPDGWVWLSAVKKNGTLYTRRGKIGEGWTSFYRQGAAGSWLP